MAAVRRILVTGASGFAGRHLMRRLAAVFPETELVGCSGPAGRRYPLDLRDPKRVDAVVANTNPDIIVHLGGTAAVPWANANPAEARAVNGDGTRHLLDAALRLAPHCLFLLVSSSEVYGESLAGGRPTPESSPCRPLSPYAESKWLAEEAGREAMAKGLHVLIARPFNHTGPGQSTDFVVPAFASQIAAIEDARQPPVIRVGWLDDTRDFSDVRDIVAGYTEFIRIGRTVPSGTTINFASGVSRKISTILDMLRARCAVPVTIEVDAARLRPGRLPAMVGDAAFAQRLLSWRSTIPFEQTLQDVLDDVSRRVPEIGA